jgi:hypothetical protein
LAEISLKIPTTCGNLWYSKRYSTQISKRKSPIKINKLTILFNLPRPTKYEAKQSPPSAGFVASGVWSFLQAASPSPASAPDDDSLVQADRIFTKHGYAPSPETIEYLKSLKVDRAAELGVRLWEHHFKHTLKSSEL